MANSLFLFFCLAEIIRQNLFWLYLWQLKEYHWGRFSAHFYTAKGKRVFLNQTFAFKIFFFLLVLSFSFLKGIIFYIFLIFYSFLFFKTIKNFFNKKLIYPVWTLKTRFLFFITFLFLLFITVGYFILFPDNFFILVLIDIITPIIVSALVFFLQLFTLLIRWSIINRAKNKIASFKDLIVVAITGSYGKTSTKEMLSEVLSQKYNILKTLKHQNSEMGIANCILNNLKKEHQIFVCEMGAYNRGGIKLLCDIVKPKMGILTGINEQHLATFGSQENIIKAKFELMDSLPIDGIGIVNWDNNYIKFQILNSKFQIPKCKIIKYSTKERADIWAENIKEEKNFISFDVLTAEGEKENFKLNIPGAYNVLNSLAVIACAKELKMTLKEIKPVLEKIAPESTGAVIKIKKGLNIIDATYSSNPTGIISHLEYLKKWKGKKVLIMPCLIELDGKAKEIHQKIGKKINEICDLAIIITRDYFNEIKKEAKEKVIYCEDSKEIFEKIKRYNNPEDIILLESRVPKELISFLNNNAENN